MKHRNAILISVIALFVGIGCFEKKTLSGNEETAPQIPQLIIFTGPGSNSAPQDLVAKIASLNGLTSTGFNYLSLATVSNPAIDGMTSTWQVNYGDLNAIIQAEKMTDASVQWTITVHGSTNSVSYNNWIAMRGVANLDGLEGDWNIFSENSTVKSAEFTWLIDNQNVRNGVLTLSSENETHEVTNNPDLSGTLIVKEGATKTYEATWDATGSGSWSSWNSQGVSTGSGDWN